jgi:hypothetical protein
VKKEDLQVGLRVILVTDDGSAFHNKEGEIIEWELGHIYPRIQFDEPINGQRRWFAPASQLRLSVPKNPQWEL